jgi:hypothetical protein
MASAVSRVLGLVLVSGGILVVLAGVFAAIGTWAVMSTYADDVPNTLAQNLMPLAVFVFPAALVGGGLVFSGFVLWRRADQPKVR